MFAARTLLLTLLVALPATAQTSNISLDGSLPGGRTDVLTGPGTGPDYTIGEDLGWRAGPNLFHSFDQFSIGVNESATFTENAGMPALSHVIARVTGGSPSAIDGTLRSEIAGADFYLLNPSGVLFGGTASIDVPASFTVSTAHRLDFAGTAASLDLLDKTAPALRVEPPSAFGFIEGGPRAPIVFSNPAGAFDLREYAVGEGQTLSAVGGDVSVQNRVRLRASRGRVQIAAVGDAIGDLPLDLAAADPDGLSGTVTVTGRSEILATSSDRSANQGTVVIRGGRLVVDEASVVRAGDFTDVDGASIDVAVSESVLVSGAGTLLRAEAPGSRPSGGMRIAAPEVTIDDGALVQTRADSIQTGGDATSRTGGDLVIEAGALRISGDAQVGTLTRRDGAGGHVRLTAVSQIEVSDGAVVQSIAASDGAGGDLTIEAPVVDISDATVGAESGVSGAAGSVAIDGERVTIAGGGATVLTSVRSGVVIADAGGDIRITSPAGTNGSIRIRDGAVVSAETLGPNAGGTIEIETGRLEVTGEGIDGTGTIRGSTIQTAAIADGAGGDIRVVAGRVELSGDGVGRAGRMAALVAAGATGDGGDIVIDAAQLDLENGGQISTTTRGEGASGSIAIDANRSVTLRGQTEIDGIASPSSIAARSETDADANDITIRAASIDVLDGAQISTRAVGTGASGNVTLIADSRVRVAGASTQGSVVSARAVDGQGGDLTIETNLLEILDAGTVDVSSNGAGPAGRIDVTARDVTIAGFRNIPGGVLRSSLAAQADGSGDAQGIAIVAGGTVRVAEGGQISASASGLGGSPGDVAIDAGNVVVDGGIITAQAAGSEGGSITVNAARNLSLAGASITAESVGGGDAGSIALRAARFESIGSRVTADAQAFGGNIEILAGELVHLVDSELTAISRGGANAQGLAGGNILIDPPAVILSNSTITANGLGNANGGNILIVGNPLLVSGDSTITASSQFGTQGQVVVSSPNAEITGELVALPSDFLDASALLAEACLARDEVTGTFSVRSVPTLPPPPDAPFSPDAGAAGQQCEAP